jgi:DNA-binding NtrC family response regulator
MKARVLVVDDDAAVGKVLGALLRQAGFAMQHAASAREALDVVAAGDVDLVVTDLRMPDMDGMQLLDALAERAPDLPAVMLTAHGSVPLAVDAMRRGARDFLLKPFDRDEMLFVVERALAGSRAERDAPPCAPAGGVMIGESPAMREVMRLVDRAAATDATVLILGESGTGKELVARAIHERSRRSGGPLVKLSCAALPDALLESELFGYEKGAFTGANARKPGRIELSDRGTLFLDEIGDVSPATQVKLLRVLQEREVEPLGGRGPVKVDLRVVAATHRDLEARIADGAFREDLFYRLNVVPIVLPALRERREDVAPLCRAFVAMFAAAHRRDPSTRFTDEALDRLAREEWPGNVRQLQNVVERLVVLGDAAQIAAADVERELARTPRATAQAEGARLDDKRRDAEREAVVEALRRASGNRTVAARILGVSRRTLYYKLEELGVR